MRDRSISVHFVRAVLSHAVSSGLDPASLLRKNRISPRLLLEDSARISIERFADLQVDTMLAMGDEALGYASRRMPIGSWSMMCYAVIGCQSLGQALSRYCRFYQLFDFGVHPHLLVEGEQATIRLINADPDWQCEPYFSEWGLFNVHRFGSWLAQEHLPIRIARLAGPPTAPAADYRHVFLAHPVRFEQDRTELILSSALLDKRVTQSEQSLRHFLRHPALIMLTQRYAGNSWTAQVREIVRLRLGGDIPELREVAQRLAVHPQTLRRRLASEGTTFKEIKNQVRRDTALHFLGKQGLSIEDIACRAGFSESSAFIRAFKSWTGVTPYTYRKGL
ncbi:MAG: AraC family transcriptional regulator [Halioglobus sp.]|nr:AraC family transcriptional regulator [Halioglobus sp.]